MRDSGRRTRKRARGRTEEKRREETGQNGDSQPCLVISDPSSKEKREKRLIWAGRGGVGGDDVRKG